MSYYVYELIDPRTGKVFYVGKGSGDRIDRHKGSGGANSNKAYLAKINEIQAAGFEIEVRQVKQFSQEEAAYAFERKHIAAIGVENLTNVKPGGNGPRRDEDAEAFRRLICIFRKTNMLTEIPTHLDFPRNGKRPEFPATEFKQAVIDMAEEFIRRKGLGWCKAGAS